MPKRNARRRIEVPLAAAAVLAAIALVSSCTSAPGASGTAGGAAAATGARGTTAAAGAGLVGPAWLLAGYDAGSFFVPLEPGHGTTARLVFSPDGALAGTTGFTALTGTWKAGKADAAGYAPVSLTVRVAGAGAAPNATAAKFERDLLACIASARLLKREKDSFRLLDGQKRILLRYLAATSE